MQQFSRRGNAINGRLAEVWADRKAMVMEKKHFYNYSEQKKHLIINAQDVICEAEGLHQ